MNALAPIWFDNPVLMRELRARMRGARAQWLIAGYLLVLSVVLFLSYLGWWTSARAGGGFSEIGSIGIWFYQMMIGVQMFLVVFIAPAITASSLTVEREQRTMDLLAVTPIPRVHIVAGKLLSALGFLVLLLAVSLPLVSLCFLLGGVDAGMVARDYFDLLMCGLDLAALALAWSSVARNTSAASLYTYASLLAPLLVWVVAGVFFAATPGVSSGPGSAMFATAQAFDPLWMHLVTLVLFLTGNGNASMAPPRLTSAGQPPVFYGLHLPWWPLALVLHALIVGLLSALAAARLELYPERKAGLLRGVFAGLLLYLSMLIFGFGNGLASAAGMGSNISSVLLLPSLGMLLICAPMFATGEIIVDRSFTLRRFIAEGWRRSSLREGSVASALPYLLLLLVGELMLFLIGGAFTSGKTAAAHSFYAAPVAVAAQGLVASAAAMTGIWCVGLLLSAACTSRWNPLMLLYGFVGLLALLPIASTSRALLALPGTVGTLAANLFYLNPLAVVADAAVKGRLLAPMNLILGTLPPWICCVAGWATISAIAVGILPVVGERSRRGTSTGGRPKPPQSLVREASRRSVPGEAHGDHEG